jgi:HSP20 family protein
MTYVRFNNKPINQSFNNFVHDLFPVLPSIIKDDLNGFSGRSSVPVNISEQENSYQLDLVAPGLNKDDFKISLENGLLTVSAEKKSGEEKKTEKMIRREFTFQSFKRSFTLDENVDAEKIDARYENGVLTLNLPKKEEVKAATKEISVQ